MHEYSVSNFKTQDSDGARISTMSEQDEPLKFFYEDGKTLYELFRKAEKLSGKTCLI